MKKIMGYLVVVILIAGFGAKYALAVEKVEYEIVKKDKKFEIRNYSSHILAVTKVDGNLEDAGDQAFGVLFRYISGKNWPKGKPAAKIAETKKTKGAKIAMTAPVGQVKEKDSWAVSFMMPKQYTMATIPKPSDSKVILRQVPKRQMAAIRYSGTWSEKGYQKAKGKLLAWVKSEGLKVTGEPEWARYNAPFTPSIFRRNEILFPVKSIK
jgi:effector-binding domain-containing protein